MKTSKKALALALAAAMAFTGIPVTDAEAASTAKLSATKATIYVGGSKTVSVKAPSTWKSVAISTVSSNKKSVATVKKASSKSFKVTAVKAGTAKVTVKVSYKTSTKKNAKKYTKTLAFTANVKSTTLTAKPAKTTLYVGETTTVKMTKVPSSSKIVACNSANKKIATIDSKGKIKALKAGKVLMAVYSQYGTKKVRVPFYITVKEPTVTATLKNPTLAVGATAKLEVTKTPDVTDATLAFKSSDDTVATVSKTGDITAVKAGTATITTTLTYKGTTKVVTTDVTVVSTIFESVKQTKADTLEAVIKGDTASLKGDSFAIKNTSNNLVYAVKSVTVDKDDATKVVITTLAPMNDGKEYSVTLDGTTKTFAATDKTKIDSVKVTTLTVPFGSLQTISAVAVDVQGVEIGTLDSDSINGKKVSYDFTPAAGGYYDGHNLYFAKKGDTATVKVTIHSGEYDSTGKEINNIDSGDVTITAVDPETVTVSDFKVRIDAGSKTFDTAAENTTVAVGDAKKAYFKFTNSKNEDAIKDGKYKVSSSDPNVLFMGETELSDSTRAVDVIGVAVGTAYILVKDKDNNIVVTLPVTVKERRAVNTLALDRASVVLSTSAAVNSEDVKTIVKDQYGNEMSGKDYDTTVELLSSSSAAGAAGTADLKTPTDSQNGKVTFKSDKTTKVATYKYKVTVTDKNDPTITRSQIVTVDVKAPNKESKNVGYAIVLDNLDKNEVDATLKAGVDAKSEILVKVVKTYDGVKESYASVSSLVVKKDGKAAAEFSTGNAVDATVATFTAIDFKSNVATGAAAGTYVVSGTAEGKNLAPVTFTVKNDTAKVSFSQDKSEFKATSTSTSAGDVVAGAFKFKFGGKDITVTKDEVSVTEGELLVNGKAVTDTAVKSEDVVFIKSVKVKVSYDGGDTNYTWIPVTINKSVKITK